MSAGVEVRHSKRCSGRDGEDCDCRPSYQAHIYDSMSGKRIRRTFRTRTAAKRWRVEALAALQAGDVRYDSTLTLRQAAERWLAGAEAGSILTRTGDPYKPAAIRGYRQVMVRRVLPAFGDRAFGSIRLRDLQDFADELVEEGLPPATIDVTFTPLRAIFRRAVRRGDLSINPVRGIELPRVRARRERFASAVEAERLIAALPEQDRPLWATALYTGLRRGELMALRWGDVDLDAGLVRVERSWDPTHSVFVRPKSDSGRRRVPVPAALRPFLASQRLRTGRRDGAALVFGTTPTRPFGGSSYRERADAAWEAAGMERITLHECRHSYASLMIAAGVNAKALSTYMGHASIAITMDRYGHLMPGSEDQAAALFDSYLTTATGTGT